MQSTFLYKNRKKVFGNNKSKTENNVASNGNFGIKANRTELAVEILTDILL